MTVGVLNNSRHKEAINNSIKTFAGGPARKEGRASSGTNNKKIASFANRQYDVFRKPFRNESSDIVKFSYEFMKMSFGKSTEKRTENLLQAIIRNPILNRIYGGNRQKTAIAKGFDRLLIDTGQFFRSIIAKVKRV